MKRIGVVSDTHIHDLQRNPLPIQLLEGLQGVDLILHAGDWMTLEVADVLKRIAPVEGVSGNNDGSDIIERYGFEKLLNVGGIRIGLVHGDRGYKQTVLNAQAAFKDEEVDVIVFGHSHVPFNEKLLGTLMFNPGSPTDKRRQPQYSYGLLHLDHEVRGELFFF